MGNYYQRDPWSRIRSGRPATGASWKGKCYIRSKPAGKRKNKSEKQIALTA